MLFSAEWCARVFGLGTPRTDLVFAARGQSNPLGVFRLETDRGRFAIKRLSAPPRPEGLAIELCAYAAGVPMPAPIEAATGGYAVRDEAGSAPVWARAYTWVDGIPGEWGRVDAQASFDVAGLMARVHALPMPAGALGETPWQPPGEAGWLLLAEGAERRGLAWGAALREKVPVLVAIDQLRSAPADEPLVPSQRDYHFPNLITPPHGPRVLVDWDAAGPSIARHEVVFFALRWATPSGGTPVRELVQAFSSGYVAGGGADFAPPTVADLWRITCPHTWWLWFNIVRDLSAAPGPDQWLTPALISQVAGPDPRALERTAELFQ